MSQTYNPVLACEEVRRMRLGAPLRSPELGVAMVLERATGTPLVVNHGERVPDARTGNYRRMHLIDVATRGLSFTVLVASSDPAFTFRVTVEFACQVTDPVAIALNKVTDMTASLLPSLTSIARETAARFDVLEPAAASNAISARLNSARDSPTVRLSSYSVSVSMVDNEEFVTEQRKIRVRKLSFDAMRPIAGGTREDMLAHIMSIEDGDPMALLDRERADRAAEVKAQIDILRTLSGTDMENFSASEVREQVLGQFFDRSKAVPGKRRKLRDSLENRAKAEIEEAKVVEGNVPPAKNTAEDGAPSSKRASRLRGSMRPAEPENES
ncbi:MULTISPECIES: hypothetical protein [Amycolatopsis]|uniref:Uncharacterized protein n=1 Tax=Amycolatopsis albidoflavus TaxID=102226 RepID=A0ABW5IDM8_9PSEU